MEESLQKCPQAAANGMICLSFFSFLFAFLFADTQVLSRSD